MGGSVEYLFAADIRLADEAARRQGWRVHGQLGWVKPDGVQVNFICLEEQLSVVGKDVTIYFVGDLSERFKRFKRKWTRLHR
jgi:hypothetical protein